MTRRSRPLRGMTLLEVSIVTAVGLAVAAAGGSTLAETARRSRATDAANNTLLPHTVSRDRAVAARTCTETVLVPALSQTLAMNTDLPAVVLSARQEKPRIASIQWSACGPDAVVTKVDFYDLDGQIDFTPYSSDDGRLVFGIDGGLTAERPGMPPASGVTVCSAGKASDDGSAGGGGKGDGDGGGAVCKPPAPQKQPSADVTFAATTYFGVARSYTVYSRLGATEAALP